MATTTNFGWTTPDNTGYVKDGALAIRTLGSAIDTSVYGLNRIAQVVTATTTSSTAATGGAGYVNVSGLSVTITPTLSSSKILIVTSFVILGTGTTYQDGYVQLLRGSTSLNAELVGTYYPGGASTNFGNYIPYAKQYVDSPATTSATTYKMQINNVLSATNWTANPGAASVQISAMEILV